MILFKLSQPHWYCTTTKKQQKLVFKRWRLHCLPSTWLQLHHLILHCSSSTSKIPTECSSWLPLYFLALFSETFSQLKLVQKIQQAPEHAHTRFRRTVQVPHWLWWAAPSANPMWWNYTSNFCVTQNNWSSLRGKSTGGPREGGQEQPLQQLCTRNPFPLPRDGPVSSAHIPATEF